MPDTVEAGTGRRQSYSCCACDGTGKHRKCSIHEGEAPATALCECEIAYGLCIKANCPCKRCNHTPAAAPTSSEECFYCCQPDESVGNSRVRCALCMKWAETCPYDLAENPGSTHPTRRDECGHCRNVILRAAIQQARDERDREWAKALGREGLESMALVVSAVEAEIAAGSRG